MVAKNSIWTVVGTKYQFEIVGIWGKGYLNNYTVQAYELKYTHRSGIQIKTAAEFLALIDQEKIKQIN